MKNRSIIVSTCRFVLAVSLLSVQDWVETLSSGDRHDAP